MKEKFLKTLLIIIFTTFAIGVLWTIIHYALIFSAESDIYNIIGDTKRQLRIYDIKRSVLSLLYIITAIVTYIIVIKLIFKAFNHIYKKIYSLKKREIKDIRVQKTKFFSTGTIKNFFILIAKMIKIIIIVIISYIYLVLIFAISPLTAFISGILVKIILNSLQNMVKTTIQYLPNFVNIGIILAIAYYTLKFLRFLANEIARGNIKIKSFYPDWANPTYKLVQFLIIAFTIALILPNIPGAETIHFKIVSVVIGAIITLGSSTAITNVIAGIILTYTRAFRVNDRVKIGEMYGDIVEQNLLVSRIKSIKNEIISIPNSKVLSSDIINYSSMAEDKGLIMYVEITVNYDTDWQTITEMLIKAAKSTNGIKKTPPPFVLYTSLTDFCITYQINGYTDHIIDLANVYSELRKNIKAQFQQTGLEQTSYHFYDIRQRS